MRHARLVVLWLWVALPLGWGVMRSVQKAMPLITGTAAPAKEPARSR